MSSVDLDSALYGIIVSSDGSAESWLSLLTMRFLAIIVTADITCQNRLGRTVGQT